MTLFGVPLTYECTEQTKYLPLRNFHGGGGDEQQTHKVSMLEGNQKKRRRGRGFPRGSAVKNQAASTEDPDPEGPTCCGATKPVPQLLSLCSRAQKLQLQEPKGPRARALQTAPARSSPSTTTRERPEQQRRSSKKKRTMHPGIVYLICKISHHFSNQ